VAFIVNVENRKFRVDLEKRGKNLIAFINNEEIDVEVARQDGNQLSLIVNSKPYLVVMESEDRIIVNGETYSIEMIDAQIQKIVKVGPEKAHKRELAIKAVMPGLVIEVMVKEGDSVKTDDGLLVVEAMKMQNEVKTPQDGIVKKILVQKGKTVNSGDTLVIIE
jgi:biotin carboxyl carrier protein